MTRTTQHTHTHIWNTPQTHTYETHHKHAYVHTPHVDKECNVSVHRVQCGVCTVDYHTATSNNWNPHEVQDEQVGYGKTQVLTLGHWIDWCCGRGEQNHDGVWREMADQWLCLFPAAQTRNNHSETVLFKSLLGQSLKHIASYLLYLWLTYFYYFRFYHEAHGLPARFQVAAGIFPLWQSHGVSSTPPSFSQHSV